MTDVQRYPLSWPIDHPRTPPHRRVSHIAFTWTESECLIHLIGEVERMGGSEIIVSTNVHLRLDGLPYTNKPRPEDTGVALYFTRKKRALVVPMDRFDNLRDNYRALGLVLESMRRIERFGSPEILERAFDGFKALPANALQRHWTSVLRLDAEASAAEIKFAWLHLARKRHPDKEGGSESAMAELNTARDQALEDRS